MEQFNNTPKRAAEAQQSQTESVMLNAKPTGWRKTTAKLARAEQYAQIGQQADVEKSRALVAVKRVAAHIGLKAGDVLLLDTLSAFSRVQDWAPGQRPIVWPSNEFLMSQTGFSLSALKRRVRRLADLGLIAFQDSPNGKRWGRRDTNGYIVEAYGFDLSPLSARTKEFEDIHHQLHAERQLCQRLKRQITVARRQIRERIETALQNALQGPWQHINGLLERLLSQSPTTAPGSDTLRNRLASFTNLLQRIEKLFVSAQPAPEHTELSDRQATKMDPKEVKNGTHIPTTNKTIDINGSAIHKEKNVALPQSTQQAKNQNSKEQRNRSLKLPNIIQACPEFKSWARHITGHIKDWSDLCRLAGQLGPMIGISHETWTQAQTGLGQQEASAALALTFDKYSAGEVKSPAAYLKGIIRKAHSGQLHLERSFKALLRKQTRLDMACLTAPS